MNSPAPELAFAEQLGSLLAQHGEVRLEYITAEMQPFSNQQRPDIVFIPRAGPVRAQIVFIEIKLSTKPITSAHALRALVDNKEFVTEAVGQGVAHYIFVTSNALPEFSESLLQQNAITVCGEAKSPDDVLQLLRQLEILS